MAVSLIAETGAIISGANSYATLEEANAFFSTQLYTEAWNNAAPDDRRRALITASQLIDSDMNFEGRRMSSSQALQWPRAGVRNRDEGASNQVFAPLTARLSREAYFPRDEVPSILKRATMRCALDLLAANRMAESDTKGIKSLSVGQGAVDIEFDGSAASQSFPLSDAVQRMLSVLGTPRYSKGGTKKVVRVA